MGLQPRAKERIDVRTTDPKGGSRKEWRGRFACAGDVGQGSREIQGDGWKF